MPTTTNPNKRVCDAEINPDHNFWTVYWDVSNLSSTPAGKLDLAGTGHAIGYTSSPKRAQFLKDEWFTVIGEKRDSDKIIDTALTCQARDKNTWLVEDKEWVPLVALEKPIKFGLVGTTENIKMAHQKSTKPNKANWDTMENPPQPARPENPHAASLAPEE